MDSYFSSKGEKHYCIEFKKRIRQSEENQLKIRQL